MNFFLAYTQNVDTPESFISLIFVFLTRKVTTVLFIEGGQDLSRSQNDKTSNIL